MEKPVVNPILISGSSCIRSYRECTIWIRRKCSVSEVTVAASEVYWLLILMGLRLACLSIVDIFQSVGKISSEADEDRISSMSGYFDSFWVGSLF